MWTPLLMLALAQAAPQPASDAVLTKIAFGSCADQNKPQPIWDAVRATKPDLFIFLGDNVYGDTVDMAELRAAYALLASKPGFAKLRSEVPIIATWDDHDYGKNDAGEEYPKKVESKQIFLDFFDEPADSQRRQHPGIYTAYAFGPTGQRVQVILPDLRTFRTTLVGHERTYIDKWKERGGYDQSDGQMLGKAQWSWLKQTLAEPADLRIFASSTQVLPEGGGWEAWTNFPAQRTALLDALGQAGNTVLISGDTHWAEVSRVEAAPPYPAFTELTSSGLTEVWRGIGPNHNRVGDAFLNANFGLITIDWTARSVRMEVRDGQNTPQLTVDVAFSELDGASPPPARAPTAKPSPSP